MQSVYHTTHHFAPHATGVIFWGTLPIDKAITQNQQDRQEHNKHNKQEEDKRVRGNAMRPLFARGTMLRTYVQYRVGRKKPALVSTSLLAAREFLEHKK